ncbi:MAG: rhodanese-like domain-containing protein [Ghiorsea sp.]
MKKVIWTVLLLLPIWATACDMNQTPGGYENASIEHVYQHWSQGEKSPIPFVFLDVRTPSEYAGGHIPGAINISIQELADRLDEVPKDKRLYVYCESGSRSTRASKLLAQSGFTQVENFKASMRGWRGAHYPIEK